MESKETYILELTVLIFIGVLVLIALSALVIHILRRRAAGDNKPVLDAIEGMRQQQSAEHSAMQSDQKSHGSALRQLLDRFGFMKRIK